ncbi:MAG: TOBE domain-containing protein [Desulfobacterales bacterium]|nr:TOBE domain-containing protein [Desulfobacterales bacterium]
MKYGARNKLNAVVKSVKSDEIMSLVKFDVTTPSEMGSVLTTESVKDLDLKPGDKVELIIKAIHVLPIKHG